MILSGRVHPSPSYPISSELAPCSPLPSQPTSPPHAQKHSLSKPMMWLNRNSSSIAGHPTRQATQKPSRVSEQKVGTSMHRHGRLGSGAIIVRTPQEALSDSPRAFELTTEEEQPVVQDVLLYDHAEKDEQRPSPPLPPLPDIADIEGRASPSAAPTLVPSSDHVSRSPSSGSPSLKTRSSRSAMLAHTRACSRPVPVHPADPDVTLPQPPFEALLLSPIPDGPIESSKLLVTLETCTTTYRTSLRTLISRPSHLSRYLTSLLSSVSETASVYSNTSDTLPAQHGNGFSSVFQDYLVSSGCLPQSFNVIHVFLDRPSAPYAHVLAHLRSLPSTPDQPETLPRAVQLGAQSPSRLETLLEVCEEASYLGLEALHKLCCDEISRAQRAPLPTCAAGTLRGKTGSVRSLRTLVEQCQAHQEVPPFEPGASKDSVHRAGTRSPARASGSSSSCENKDMLAVRERSREKKGLNREITSPPPGWI